MPNFYLPLSGNVRQEINPWTWFTKIANGQLGFININMGKSSDPGLEQQILDDVGIRAADWTTGRCAGGGSHAHDD